VRTGDRSVVKTKFACEPAPDGKLMPKASTAAAQICTAAILLGDVGAEIADVRTEFGFQRA
jgi:hypothetical protein